MQHAIEQEASNEEKKETEPKFSGHRPSPASYPDRLVPGEENKKRKRKEENAKEENAKKRVAKDNAEQNAEEDAEQKARKR